MPGLSCTAELGNAHHTEPAEPKHIGVTPGHFGMLSSARGRPHAGPEGGHGYLHTCPWSYCSSSICARSTAMRLRAETPRSQPRWLKTASLQEPLAESVSACLFVSLRAVMGDGCTLVSVCWFALPCTARYGVAWRGIARLWYGAASYGIMRCVVAAAKMCRKCVAHHHTVHTRFRILPHLITGCRGPRLGQIEHRRRSRRDSWELARAFDDCIVFVSTREGSACVAGGIRFSRSVAPLIFAPQLPSLSTLTFCFRASHRPRRDVPESGRCRTLPPPSAHDAAWIFLCTHVAFWCLMREILARFTLAPAVSSSTFHVIADQALGTRLARSTGRPTASPRAW